MAKLAVIFFLFALCAVAMAARIAREEPTKKPFEELQGQFNQLLDSFKNMLDNPEIKSTLEGLSKQFQEAGSKIAESIQAKPST